LVGYRASRGRGAEDVSARHMTTADYFRAMAVQCRRLARTVLLASCVAGVDRLFRRL
jgi:hypothetical protein